MVPPVSLTPPEATLLPKLRVHFAEFLNAGSLARLRLFIAPTCVGLRYGPIGASLRDYFSAPWLHPLRFDVSPLAVTAHLRRRISLPPSSTRRFDRNYRSPAGPRLMRHPLELLQGTGI